MTGHAGILGILAMAMAIGFILGAVTMAVMQ